MFGRNFIKMTISTNIMLYMFFLLRSLHFFHNIFICVLMCLPPHGKHFSHKIKEYFNVMIISIIFDFIMQLCNFSLLFPPSSSFYICFLDSLQIHDLIFPLDVVTCIYMCTYNTYILIKYICT